MQNTPLISRPDDPALDELCQELRLLADTVDDGSWPEKQLELCGGYGVYRWFLSPAWGGLDWEYRDVVEGYMRLAASCLTTTFILTQRTGACRRIASSENNWVKEQVLPALASGEMFASVGISHLTTSRRHLKKPVLRARETADGFILDGFSPWVTGGIHCDYVVTGATLDDGRQLLAAVPLALAGVKAGDYAQLVGLTGSHTGPVHFEQALVERQFVLDGPVENVMAQGTGARTGGLETSSLAVGLASAAIAFLEKESQQREDLAEAASNLRGECDKLNKAVRKIASGSQVCSNEQLRTRANSLALRASQAALTAAKGTGYMVGHDAGRWCREALFFLVWSCPQPVSHAALCELAWIAE